MKARTVLKNVFYSFGANVISLCISVLMILFVPKFMPIEEYGMWQLFLFYFSYLGFLHFGWEDGIYLRYAGKNYNELDSKLLSGQFYGIIFLQIVEMLIVIMLATFFVGDFIKRNVLICAVGLLVFVNFNNCCNFIMQITNRIKDYAKLLLTERIIFVSLVFLFIFSGANHFLDLYIAKFASLSCLSLVSFYMCQRLLHLDFYPIASVVDEAIRNIEVGSKLMFANIANMLIVGIIRYGISIGWDITTFGKISLMLSISNFLMLFISSVSIVLFPILKHMDIKRLPQIYMKIRNVLTLMLLFMLNIYYPLKVILIWWLPKYADSLIYMSVLFPVCLFQSKISLLINTYLKSMRKEKIMLQINLASVTLAAIVTVITVGAFHSLNATVFSIVFLYAFQCILAESCMERFLHLNFNKEMLVELLMIGIFIVSGIVFDSWVCTLIYGFAYLVYLIVNQGKVRKLLQIVIH